MCWLICNTLRKRRCTGCKRSGCKSANQMCSLGGRETRKASGSRRRLGRSSNEARKKQQVVKLGAMNGKSKLLSDAGKHFHSPHHCVGFLFLACTPALPARPSARPRPPAPARRPTYTDQRTPTKLHQPTHTKQCKPTNSPSNVHQPTTNAHQEMHTNKQCRPTNSHQPARTKQCTPTNARRQRTSNAHQRTPCNAQL